MWLAACEKSLRLNNQHIPSGPPVKFENNNCGRSFPRLSGILRCRLPLLVDHGKRLNRIKYYCPMTLYTELIEQMGDEGGGDEQSDKWMNRYFNIHFCFARSRLVDVASRTGRPFVLMPTLFPDTIDVRIRISANIHLMFSFTTIMF